MASVHVLVLTGYGTNSHAESAYAAKLAGADKADIVHFADIVSGDVALSEYNFLIFPGGFLDGDDLGAAHAAAKRWLYAVDAKGTPLMAHLQSFIQEGKLILGICNGFQLLVKLGLLPALGGEYFTQQVSLAHNASGKYEDRWVRLGVNPAAPCIFTKGLDNLTMPVRHGEGRLVPKDEATLLALQANNLVSLSYLNEKTLLPTQEYPANPNGSPQGIAGLCDPTGRILGLMPHPEAFNDPTNAPLWTRGVQELPGIVLFENAVRYLR